jgi:hypothetical protein
MRCTGDESDNKGDSDSHGQRISLWDAGFRGRGVSPNSAHKASATFGKSFLSIYNLCSKWIVKRRDQVQPSSPCVLGRGMHRGWGRGSGEKPKRVENKVSVDTFKGR